MTDAPDNVPLGNLDATSELSAVEFEQRIREYQQSTPDLYYTHSGSPGFAAPLALIIGVPVIAALAALYSYIVVYCPIVGYVNILFVGGFVISVGIVVSVLGKFGKCRSNGVMGVIGFLCGVFALYAAWIFFITALTGKRGAPVALLDLVLQPVGVSKLIYAVNQEGWWGPSGIAQWILVAIEAVIIVGWPTMVALSALSREVFCEDCNKWCKSGDKMLLQPTPEMLSIGIGNVQPEHFLKLDEATETDYPRIDADVLKCQHCQNLQGIRFEYVSQELDDGELKEARADVPKVLMQRG